MLAVSAGCAPKEQEPHVFIALGDSVSFGFGITPEERYTSVLFERLKEEGYVSEYINHSVNGYTSADLLRLLNGLDDGSLEHIKNARIITVNIGGNNILSPFTAYLPDLKDISGLISLMLGLFPAELEAELQKGIDAFSAELAEIMMWLNARAPGADVIINTVYNPVPREFMGVSLGLHSAADKYTRLINEIIYINREAHGYLVADVFSRFSEEPDITGLMNFGADAAAMTFDFDIIHPNAAGHEIIAGLNYDAFADCR
jgi:lysophospholipase L1-like esterase